MYRFIVLLFLYCTPTTALALEQSAALTCVNRGIDAFLAGGPIDHLIDIPYLMQRGDIAASEAQVAALLNARAAANKNLYGNVSISVVGVPQPKSGGYYLVAGHATGLERDAVSLPWRRFNHSYIIWMKQTVAGCQIGVLAIDEVFRLALWVKQNL